ncbi:hypothetical protein M1N24_01065 [Dehalococcoidia bacterium]|nr:hypothetical protein [Dehalococcoidia bacterium]
MAFNINSIQTGARRHVMEYGFLDKEGNPTESGQTFFRGLIPLLNHNTKLLQNPDRQKQVLDVVNGGLRENREAQGKPHKDLTRLNLDPDKPLSVAGFILLIGELNSYLSQQNLPELNRAYDTDGNLLVGYEHNKKFDFDDLPNPNAIIQNALLASRVSMAGFDFYSLIENL